MNDHLQHDGLTKPHGVDEFMNESLHCASIKTQTSFLHPRKYSQTTVIDQTQVNTIEERQH